MIEAALAHLPHRSSASAHPSGTARRRGIEGTGSYGAGLTRALIAMGLRVIEVGRVNRQLRRRHGKTDTVDAESAARAVLAGEATDEPKLGDGAVEMIRHLKIARDTALLLVALALARWPRSRLAAGGAHIREEVLRAR